MKLLIRMEKTSKEHASTRRIHYCCRGMMCFPASHFSPAEVQKELSTSCYSIMCSGSEGEGVTLAVSHSSLKSQPKAAPPSATSMGGKPDPQMKQKTSAGKHQDKTTRPVPAFLLCDAFLNISSGANTCLDSALLQGRSVPPFVPFAAAS